MHFARVLRVSDLVMIKWHNEENLLHNRIISHSLRSAVYYNMVYLFAVAPSLLGGLSFSLCVHSSLVHSTLHAIVTFIADVI